MPAPPAAEPEAKADQPEDAPKASPTTLLIIDTETSGLDPQQDQCLEVGCICLMCRVVRCWPSNRSFAGGLQRGRGDNRIPAAVTRSPSPGGGAGVV